MTGMGPVAELDARFGDDGAEPTPWPTVVRVLEEAELFWISTVRDDGRPHVTPLPAIWRDGVLYFCTGDQEQKSANLRANPNCVLAAGTNQFHSGFDIVVEGVAERVTEHARLARLAALWKSKLDWDFGVGEDAFTDPAGRAGLVFGVAPAKVLAFGKGPYTQTRYRFG